jgi:6-phosphogluconolactonase (cycloisomerase 2 family)
LSLATRSNAQSSFVYTNDDYNGHANSVSGFSIGADGSLSKLPGSPFMTGGLGGGGGDTQARRIAITPDGKFLFASNAGLTAGVSSISAFSVDPGSGNLTLLAGSPYSTGTDGGEGISLGLSPDGSFLYALNTNSHQFDGDYISIFRVTNGTLELIGPLVHAPLTGPGFSGSAANIDLRVTADGNYVYVSQYAFNTSNGRIAIFSRAPDGSLSSPQFFTSNPQSGFTSLETNCSGDRLFALNYFAKPPSVSVFAIGSGGMLSEIPNSPFTISSDGGGSLYLSPDEARLFVGNNHKFPSSVSVFSVSSDGTLGLVPNSPFAVPGASLLSGLATDPSGQFLYGAALPHDVVALSVNQDGSLTPIAGSPFFTSQSFQSITSLASYPPKSCPVSVNIEIKPGSSAATINPKSHGEIPVAILSSANFDAFRQVDTRSLTFGHSGNEQSLAFCNAAAEDVNGDGLPDLVCHFNTQQAGFVAGDTQGVLKGLTLDGRAILGTAPIQIVPD